MEDEKKKKINPIREIAKAGMKRVSEAEKGKSEILKPTSTFKQKTEKIDTKSAQKQLSGDEFVKKQNRIKRLKKIKQGVLEKSAELSTSEGAGPATRYVEKAKKIIDEAKERRGITEKIGTSQKGMLKASSKLGKSAGNKALKKTGGSLVKKVASKAGPVASFAAALGTAISAKDSMAAMPGEESGPARGTEEYKLEGGKGDKEKDKQIYEEAMKKWRSKKLRR